MNIQGIVITDILAIGLIIFILNLVRIHKLHVGYAVVWLLPILGLIMTISIPSLLEFIPKVVGAIYPVSALSLIAFVFIFVVLIFFSVKLSTLSARQGELIELMALKELLNQEERSERNKSG